ncbi:MAG: GAF domain-containing protein [Steroidobacteraceae bacterium]
METFQIDSAQAKPALYAALTQQLRALIQAEPDTIANLANAASLLFYSLPDINWVGFYLLKEGEELVVGPFQGRPACVRIPVGRGVCGTAAARRTTLIVPNVHEFPGHIACDTASNAEIVVPLLRADRLLGVLDVDSPKFSRFDEQDQVGLEEFAAVLSRDVLGR